MFLLYYILSYIQPSKKEIVPRSRWLLYLRSKPKNIYFICHISQLQEQMQNIYLHIQQLGHASDYSFHKTGT